LSTPHLRPDEADDTPSLEERLDADDLFDDDELDMSSDPFEIAAAKERYAGVPLFFMIHDQEIH
jgi:hypothetical protein